MHVQNENGQQIFIYIFLHMKKSNPCWMGALFWKYNIDSYYIFAINESQRTQSFIQQKPKDSLIRSLN